MPEYPKFTPEMKSTYTVLCPQMLPVHFKLFVKVLKMEGYNVVVLENDGPEVVEAGLKYVHNDTCYPALLVIGQMITALQSGKYDLDRTALLITQTGGGCRASNYIHLLRKALVKAGMGHVPVASLNFSGLEKDSGFKMSLKCLYRFATSLFYGDMLMLLANQVRPYEDEPGAADRLVDEWADRLIGQFGSGRGFIPGAMARNFDDIARSFSEIPVTRVPKVKVGIVGEIYVKYSPLGNNRLEEFLASEGCEVNVPGLIGFCLYCLTNQVFKIDLYGGSKLKKQAFKALFAMAEKREKLMADAVAKYPGLTPPPLFTSTIKCSEGLISNGVQMGEGWLLTSEMAELVKSGFENIVCTQPFGCLPNHIVAKGMANKLRAMYPQANIVAIDYDPGATKVNQENRIKLMLSVARERLEARKDAG